MLNSHFPNLVQIAQSVYDAWTCADGKGRCVKIAEQWGYYFNLKGMLSAPIGVFEDHTTCGVMIGKRLFNVDLPAYRYEQIWAGRWIKLPHIKMEEEYIECKEIRGRRKRDFFSDCLAWANELSLRGCECYTILKNLDPLNDYFYELRGKNDRF